MKLGIVGMLPGDFRTFQCEQMQAIRDMGFTGFGFHFNGEDVFTVTQEDCAAYRRFIAGENLDLAQFTITYDDCLFYGEPAQIEQVSAKIQRGTEIAAQLEAQCFLLRPGGLNPAGPWMPHRNNHLPEHVGSLVETLRPLAAKAEQEGVVLAMETHAVSIMDPPEKCREIVEAVGSDNLRLILDVVNHFQCLQQVYHSSDLVNHIFDETGTISPVAHIKDLKVSNGLVLHIDQEVPGEGELDLALVLKRFNGLFPHGYGLIEHLGLEQIPLAVANVRRIAAEIGVKIDEY
ncbi:MAG TPA: sugar phosphate isomerase/epimerase [Candidatus Latescibacteria bacterium]|nr:sugar phosphate isomerase/epimerase [Candidatus Handelsmanbacteria bacterium]HIL10888.1 sugar phosphate isomerase/epimerase [Candidatus Latescibacterota bacterium]